MRRMRVMNALESLARYPGGSHYADTATLFWTDLHSRLAHQEKVVAELDQVCVIDKRVAGMPTPGDEEKKVDNREMDSN
jgi:hypothetical protein